jgi:cytochrome b561
MPGIKRPGYTLVQVVLHWLIAVLVMFQIIFGESMVEAEEAAGHGEALGGFDAAFASAHYWTGLAILALVLVRLSHRLVTGAPVTLDENPALRVLGAAMHWAFYFLLVAVPVTGLLAFCVDEEFGDIHAVAKPVFLALIAIHAAAALYHHFVLHDGTLRRMLVPVSNRPRRT